MPALVIPKAVALTTPPTCSVFAVTVRMRLALSVTAPVPRFSELVPVKVKLPFQVWALLVRNDCASPLVLSNVPPAMTSVPVPIAEFAEDEPPWLMSNVPVALVVRPPVKVLAPPSFNVPAPVCVTEKAPEVIPAAVLPPLIARVWPASGIAQVWFAVRTIGALIAAEAAPVPKAMPPLPSVSVPKEP